MLGVRPLGTYPISTMPVEFESDTAIITVRYGTHSFATRTTDSPANTQIMGRIKNGLSLTRSLRKGPDGQFGAIIETRFSELVLDNGDGALDALAQDYYADGRPVRIKIGAKEVTRPTRITPVHVTVGGGASSGDASSPYQIDYPDDGIAAGDLFTIQVTINDRGEAGQLSAVPTGWEVLDESSSGALYQALLYRLADGTEAGGTVALHWESSDPDNDVIIGRIRQWRYVDPDQPFEGLTSPIIGDLDSIDLPTVVTTEPRSLATYWASWSDNVSTSSPTGGMGGSWANIGNIVSTSTGDDASNRVASAEIAAPGTITGGTLATAPTDTPQSEVSLLVGVALRGLPVAGGQERVQPYSSFALAYSSVAGTWRQTHDELRLEIRDLGIKLQDKLQTLSYAGSGGKNGPSELTGRSRPLGFGAPPNVKIQLIDPPNLIFQANSGPVVSFDQVFDRGAELTFGADHATYDLLEADTVPVGSYATCLAEGYLKTGTGVDTGNMTANVTFTSLATHASVIKAIALRGLTEEEIDDGSFTIFAAAQPAGIGIFFPSGDESTIEQAIEQVALSGGAMAGQDRSGLYRVQRIEAPGAAVQWAFDERTIVFESGVRAERNEPPYGVPWSSWQVGYARNWTVQRGSADVAESVSAARKLFLEAEYRYVFGQNAEVALSHAAAHGATKTTLMLDQADAENEAARLAALYGLGRGVYTVPVKTALFSVTMGDVVRITYPRWGLSQGKNGRVIGIDDDADSGISDLRLFI